MSSPASSGLDRSEAPAAGPIRSFGFPPVTSTSLPNGLQLRVAQMARLPLVTVSVVMDAGEALLDDGSGGLAVLSGSALEGGSEGMPGPELAEALEGIGTGLSVHTGWDATTVSLTCLADRMEEAVALLSEAILRPAFPEGEVTRFREQRLAAIRQRRMDPGSLADDAAADFIFSSHAPYHRPLAGSPESVEGIGPEQIREFVDRHFEPSSAGLVVVGDVELAEVQSLAGRYFGDWEVRPAPKPERSFEPRFRERRIFVVDRPGSVQSEIRIGQVGASRSTPRYFPLNIFNTVLGGAFTSRLMLNLREDKGFTYGIRSRFSFRRGTGPFEISTAVATDVTAPAIREALTELTGLIERGPEEEEVARARDFIAGVFPLGLETTGQVASKISGLLVYDLPDDYFGSYRDQIRAVSMQGVLEAGQAVLRPEELIIVVVGDAEQVRGPLQELGLGSVEIASPF